MLQTARTVGTGNSARTRCTRKGDMRCLLYIFIKFRLVLYIVWGGLTVLVVIALRGNLSDIER